MRIAVVSQYFAPEVGATQNRLGAFVDGLVARGHDLTVICEQPNHPAGVFHPGFGRRPLVSERAPGRTVRRLWVAASPAKTTARRLAFYGTFAAGAGALLAAGPRHDVVLATSPPLPGALAAGMAAAGRAMPFVLDVRDLWPAAAEALGELSSPSVVRAFERAERWLYRRSAAVTATTRPFCHHIDRVAGLRRAVHLPNGALDELVSRTWRPPPPAPPFVLGYVGNLGIAQGLDGALDAARRVRDGEARIRLVGQGPLAQTLRATRERERLDALEILPPVPLHRVGEALEGCHALLVPLGAHAMLESFIPSKLYDAMAVGRPVIVAARGEAAALVADAGCGLTVAPEDGAALSEAIRRLAGDPEMARAMGLAGRARAHEHRRSLQVSRLERVLELAAAGRGR